MSDSDLDEIVKAADKWGQTPGEYLLSQHRDAGRNEAPSLKPYITLAELSRRTGLGVKELRSLADAGRIPFHQMTRRRRFLESEVRSALAKKRPEKERVREACQDAVRRVMRERGLTSP